MGFGWWLPYIGDSLDQGRDVVEAVAANAFLRNLRKAVFHQIKPGIIGGCNEDGSGVTALINFAL